MSTIFAAPSDIPAVGKFLENLGGPYFHERFPSHDRNEFYRWKYLKNPCGNAVVGLAKAGEQIVSAVAATPKVIWVGGNLVRAYELGDFFTADEFRRQGIFSELVRAVCSRVEEMGATLVYVSPNDASFPILVRHQSFVEAIQLRTRRFLLPSRTLAHKFGVPERILRLSGLDWIAEKFAFRGSRGNSVEVVAGDRFGPESDQLWERLRGRYSLALARGSDYLNWRFVDGPTPYRIWFARRGPALEGFLVAFISRARSVAFILDLFVGKDDDATASSLLSAGFRELFAQGVRTIYAWTLSARPRSAAARWLRRACMLQASENPHFAIRALKPISEEVWASCEGWHLSLGDFDSA